MCIRAGADPHWARDGDYGLAVTKGEVNQQHLEFVASGCEPLGTPTQCSQRPTRCIWDQASATCSTIPLQPLSYDNASRQLSINSGSARRCFAASDGSGFGDGVHATPCNTGPIIPASSRWHLLSHPAMAHLHGHREDSGVMFQHASSGLCLRPAPYAKGDPRFSPRPRLVSVFPCVSNDPALQFVARSVGKWGVAGLFQAAWRFDTTQCLSTADETVLLSSCNSSDTYVQ